MSQEKDPLINLESSNVTPLAPRQEKDVPIGLPLERQSLQWPAFSEALTQKMSMNNPGGFKTTVASRASKEKGRVVRGLGAVANALGDLAVASLDFITWIPVKWARLTVMKPIELWQSGHKGKALAGVVAQAVAYYFFPPLGLATLSMLALSVPAALWKRQVRKSDIRYLPEPQRAQMESELKGRRSFFEE